MNVIKQVKTGLAVMGIAVLGFPAMALAATSTEVVTERDVVRQTGGTQPTNSWVVYTAKPKVGASTATATFRTGPKTPPLNAGSLELNTPADTDKITAFNFDHVGTKLSDVDKIAYNTHRSAGSLQQVAALNVVIDFNGPNNDEGRDKGFATLVFEPVYNTNQGPVTSGQWQDWIATGSGNWWSTRDINKQCTGATDTCDKTWAEIVANNPDATILGGVGVNQGSSNPGLVTAVDAFTFDDVTYDFEKTPVTALSKEDCKNEGYKVFQANYKNQGACVSSVVSNSNKSENTSMTQRAKDLLGL